MVRSRSSREDGHPPGAEWDSSVRVRGFRKALLKWYRRHRRVFPWRETRDPYRIWISEIMLQQTTVAAVIPYYRRFFEKFPDLKSLANAPEQEVLRHWEGLGYYSRARNLHRTARILMDDHSGLFPSVPEELRKLPGIGPYTAGAVASFAFDRPAPIVEANTLRLYARLSALRGDPRSTSFQKDLWKFATRLHSIRGSGGELNQALMELGGTVCKPKAPDCGLCPVAPYCDAFRARLVDRIPESGKQKMMTNVHECALLIHRRGKWLIRQIPEGERWAGLWDFPRLKLGILHKEGPPQLSQLELGRRLREEFGIQADLMGQLKPMKHTVTRFRILLDLAVMEFVKGKISVDGSSRWCGLNLLQRLPLPTTGRKIAHLIGQSLEGGDRLL